MNAASPGPLEQPPTPLGSRRPSAGGGAAPGDCPGRLYGNRCVRQSDHPGMCYAPGGGLSARLRQKADEAHGEGLRRAGYNAALDDLSILLAAEAESLEAELSRSVGYCAHLRWALRAIEGMRP